SEVPGENTTDGAPEVRVLSGDREGVTARAENSRAETGSDSIGVAGHDSVGRAVQYVLTTSVSAAASIGRNQDDGEGLRLDHTVTSYHDQAMPEVKLTEEFRQTTLSTPKGEHIDLGLSTGVGVGIVPPEGTRLEQFRIHLGPFELNLKTGFDGETQGQIRGTPVEKGFFGTNVFEVGMSAGPGAGWGASRDEVIMDLGVY